MNVRSARVLWSALMLSSLALAACDGGGVKPGVLPTDTTVPQDVAGEDVPPTGDEGPGRDLVETDTAPADVPVPDGAVCRPGETRCLGTNFLRCKDDGSDFTVTPCGEGTTCTPEGCKGDESCTPNVADCDAEGRVVVCLPDGSGWTSATPCGEGYTCQAGRCLAAICTPGQTECTQTSVLVCSGTPPAWLETPCAEGTVCFKGTCVECFTDDHCEKPQVCLEGICGLPPLEVLTDALPVGAKNASYEAELEAAGGTPPYAWAVTAGVLPDGLALSAEGVISGKASKPGNFPFTVTVTDAADATASKALSIEIRAGSTLEITSKSPLPQAEEGSDYAFQFAAVGGKQPYTWGVIDGALPAGLTLTADGKVTGVPAAHGDFEFTVRVVDVGDPLGIDAKPFSMNVKIAPLEIVGDQVINLFLTKAVILPLITIVEGIPIPYSTKLQAKGGVKPYAWAEQELPSFVKTFIPKAGIPQGLTLATDGTLSGSVTDTSLVFELKVPFVNYTLTGFFFMAQVTDAQDPADSDSAIYLIPTIPVNLGGGGGLPF